jgi:hypothetical protein
MEFHSWSLWTGNLLNLYNEFALLGNYFQYQKYKSWATNCTKPGQTALMGLCVFKMLKPQIKTAQRTSSLKRMFVISSIHIWKIKRIINELEGDFFYPIQSWNDWHSVQIHMKPGDFIVWEMMLTVRIKQMCVIE